MAHQDPTRHTHKGIVEGLYQEHRVVIWEVEQMEALLAAVQEAVMVVTLEVLWVVAMVVVATETLAAAVVAAATAAMMAVAQTAAAMVIALTVVATAEAMAEELV